MTREHHNPRKSSTPSTGIDESILYRSSLRMVVLGGFVSQLASVHTR